MSQLNFGHAVAYAIKQACEKRRVAVFEATVTHNKEDIKIKVFIAPEGTKPFDIEGEVAHANK